MHHMCVHIRIQWAPGSCQYKRKNKRPAHASFIRGRYRCELLVAYQQITLVRGAFAWIHASTEAVLANVALSFAFQGLSIARDALQALQTHLKSTLQL
jgi:hypothetical protein